MAWECLAVCTKIYPTLMRKHHKEIQNPHSLTAVGVFYDSSREKCSGFRIYFEQGFILFMWFASSHLRANALLQLIHECILGQ